MVTQTRHQEAKIPLPRGPRPPVAPPSLLWCCGELQIPNVGVAFRAGEDDDEMSFRCGESTMGVSLEEAPPILEIQRLWGGGGATSAAPGTPLGFWHIFPGSLVSLFVLMGRSWTRG